MAKLAATELAKRCALEGVQVMGGYGYATEYPMERYLRAAVVTTIYGGTSEIQKNIIAKTLGLSACVIGLAGGPAGPIAVASISAPSCGCFSGCGDRKPGGRAWRERTHPPAVSADPQRRGLPSTCRSPRTDASSDRAVGAFDGTVHGGRRRERRPSVPHLTPYASPAA